HIHARARWRARAAVCDGDRQLGLPRRQRVVAGSQGRGGAVAGAEVNFRPIRIITRGEFVKSRAWSFLLVATGICVASPSFADLKKGDKLQTIANLHPDMGHRVLFTLNYQLPGLIPVCSDVRLTKVSKKKL